MSLEVSDEFQNQVDFYLEHDRRSFNYHDFHNNKPSCQEILVFHVLLERALKNSGFEIISTQETFPPTYIVSKVYELHID